MTVPMLRADGLAALPGISHAFFTRQGGVSGGLYASLNGGRGSQDDPQAVAENRRLMAQALNTGDEIASPYQIHSAVAVVTNQAWPAGTAPQADAVVTAQRGLAIGIATADCGPVLFADAENGVVGAAHAGWKGALGGVLEATIATMEAQGANRKSIHAALGPCIRQPSYEVGGEFIAAFAEADPANVRFFASSQRTTTLLFDLGGFITARLTAAGIGSVEDLGLDTYADEERFFSFRRATHRKEDDYGRLIAGIALV